MTKQPTALKNFFTQASQLGKKVAEALRGDGRTMMDEWNDHIHGNPPPGWAGRDTTYDPPKYKK